MDSQFQSMVSWQDYSRGDGFGRATMDDVRQLRKALNAGDAITSADANAAGTESGFALRVESLERTLKNTTYRMEHIKLWKSIPKIAAFNTVEEYNQITEYGAGAQGAFMAEGALPSETDASYDRKYAVVKFLGTTRIVSHVMSLVKPAHGNVIAQETVAGTMYLLRQLEKSLFTGDSSIDELEFDGFDKLITDGAPADHIIDLRGAPLSEDNLIDAALTVQNAPAFGIPTDLYINPAVKSDLVKSFFPKARYDLTQKRDGMIGLDIDGFTSPAGDVRFNSDVFIDDGGVAPAADAGATAPGAPTWTIQPNMGVGAAALWAVGTGDHDQGDYYWAVSACNSGGSAAAVESNQLTVNSANEVEMEVTRGTGTTTYYKLYRTLRGGASGTSRFIKRVASAGAATPIVDDNTRLPRTTSGYLFQQDASNMSFAQLAPMVKVPLATINSSIRWMQLIYGTPKLYTPRHNVIFRNIGRTADFVGAP
jgi:hypothetical protein